MADDVAMHDVNVRYSLQGFARGQTVSVHFDEAVTIAGRHIAVAPLTFQLR